MTTPSPFDHERDAVLGEALRQALDAGDASAFAARLMTRVGAAHWDVLAGWARPGIAAALVAAMAAGFVVGRMLSRPPALDDAVVPSEVAVLASPAPPDAGIVFASWERD